MTPLLISLWACTGDDPEPTDTTTPVTGDTGTVVPDGAVHDPLSMPAEPTLDPSLFTDVASTNVGLGLFEGLMTYDPQTGKGYPALAEVRLRISFWDAAKFLRFEQSIAAQAGYELMAVDDE